MKYNKILKLSAKCRMSRMGFLSLIAFCILGLTAVSCSSGDTENNTGASSGQDISTEQVSNEPAEPADDGKGIGPVSHVDISETIDAAMADEGKVIFESKCTACHTVDETRKVGPGLADVTERRKPEWIMNMILNPGEMTQKDPQAKALLAEYIAPMANQSLTEAEARSILEYFRQIDQQ